MGGWDIHTMALGAGRAACDIYLRLRIGVSLIERQRRHTHQEYELLKANVLSKVCPENLGSARGNQEN